MKQSEILQKLKSQRLLFDGAFGTQLQARGLKPGELPELWNLTQPEQVAAVHREYLAAGCDVITSNTFGANPLKLPEYEAVIRAALDIARAAADEFSQSGQKRYVAFDIGPSGRLLQPLGDLPFEEAVECFAAVVKIAASCGADLILIETMTDSYETKAAVLAAKENSELPVFVTNAYDEQGRLLSGTKPAAMVAMLEGLRVDALGVNCSLGPAQMQGIVEELLTYSSLPVMVNPNAGMPRLADGRTVYDVKAADFAAYAADFARGGVAVLGGCCGTTPEYIAAVKKAVADIPYHYPAPKPQTLVSSYGRLVTIGGPSVIIGERINPTGKAKFKQALRDGDIDYVLNEGLKQQAAGAQILDVNVGLPEINEQELLPAVVQALQKTTDLPLQIDSVDPKAMETALRLYNGKPLINSVNGKAESLSQILPLAAKYGGVLIALTLDEEGIPATAAGRLRIAEKIIKAAAEYGIEPKDIVVDPLCLAVSAEPDGALVTLESLKLLRQQLGINTSLGVSNVSFGLPQRELVNSTFYALALAAGLSCAIINPLSVAMMKVYRSFMVLQAEDEGCLNYIDFASRLQESQGSIELLPAVKNQTENEGLAAAIIEGREEKAAALTEEILQTAEPLAVINGEIIPALDQVGVLFEKGEVFLPQLLRSANAATAAFEVVKTKLPANVSTDKKVVLATVEGDIHDIGKNIVRVLLENYGFYVIDLGRDVKPQLVCDTVKEEAVRLVGLSALMTTTVPSMEATIKLLRHQCPGVKVIVGGAVLTQEYADMIGADFYAKDAMESVRIASEVLG